MLMQTKLDGTGRLALSEEQLRRWGLGLSDDVLVRETEYGLTIIPLDPPLGKVYVEPTTRCNLQCPMCVRQYWDEPFGDLPWEAFERLIADLRRMGTCRRMAFWGIGEPLLHPNILQMIDQAHRLGLETELITNGLLVDEAMALGLIEAGLDTIVFSIDSTSTTSFGHDRAGADHDVVVDNIRRLRRAAMSSNDQTVVSKVECISRIKKPLIGLEFVATKENINELPKLRGLASAVGASFVLVSNLLPYTAEMCNQILYYNSTDQWYPAAQFERRSDLVIARMDSKAEYLEPLAALTANTSMVDSSTNGGGQPCGYCRFVSEGSVAVSWDGTVSPCIALMHSYRCYVLGREKHIRRYAVGNIGVEELDEIWHKPEFANFRKRVQVFDFSPCSSCGSCELADNNEEDCLGNPFPACGDCLWAKGVIRCP